MKMVYAKYILDPINITYFYILCNCTTIFIDYYPQYKHFTNRKTTRLNFELDISK